MQVPKTPNEKIVATKPTNILADKPQNVSANAAVNPANHWIENVKFPPLGYSRNKFSRLIHGSKWMPASPVQLTVRDVRFQMRFGF